MKQLFIFFDEAIKSSPLIFHIILEAQKNPNITINLLYEKYGNNIKNINQQEEINLLLGHQIIFLFVPLLSMKTYTLFDYWCNTLLEKTFLISHLKIKIHPLLYLETESVSEKISFPLESLNLLFHLSTSYCITIPSLLYLTHKPQYKKTDILHLLNTLEKGDLYLEGIHENTFNLSSSLF